MLNHSAVPDELVYSLLMPLIKDKSGLLGDKTNYRAIALSTTLPKVLELILIERPEHCCPRVMLSLASILATPQYMQQIKSRKQ